VSALRQLVRAEEAERTLPSEWTGDEESLHTVEQAAVALQGMSVTPPIGVACKGVVPIPYNDADTGNVVQIAGLPKAHDILSLTEPTGRNRRAYSFGVIGYLGE
jgi:hypothetical protein